MLTFILTIYYIRRGKLPYLRRVLALDVIEDAVGRSTEMGRPILESYGTVAFDQFVIASLSILSHVARLAAKVDNRVIVPIGGNPGSMITRPVAVDIVKSAYEAEGKGELFNENDMPFLSYEFFSFAAGYVGLILRERPGAVIVGPETADALMYVEEANAVGALTIATGSYISNVAVLACAANYIMIGEEALAAGAYLSKEQSRITSLRTVDIFKFLAIVLVVVGVILVQLKNNFIIDLLSI
jgi:hypothetical protein